MRRLRPRKRWCGTGALWRSRRRDASSKRLIAIRTAHTTRQRDGCDMSWIRYWWLAGFGVRAGRTLDHCWSLDSGVA